MPALHQRNRIVVFRVTESEYNSLRSACAAAGSRNLSDYTRNELLTAVQGDPRGARMEQRFGAIEQKLAQLHKIVQDVADRVSAPRAFAKSSGDGV